MVMIIVISFLRLLRLMAHNCEWKNNKEHGGKRTFGGKQEQIKLKETTTFSTFLPQAASTHGFTALALSQLSL